MICLWVLGFDSFKEWTDDKLQKFCIYCQGMGLKSKSQVPSLGWKCILKAFWLLKKLELPNQSRRKILFLQTTWQSKVIINLVNQFSESCFVRKLCYTYSPKHAFCGRFSAIVTESDVRNEGGVGDLAQSGCTLMMATVVASWEILSTNYCESDLTKYKHFLHNQIGTT